MSAISIDEARHDHVRQARGRLREEVRARRGAEIQGDVPAQQAARLWAAEKLGLNGPDADAYAKEVVVADFEEAGDDDVFRKVRKDFDAKGVAQSDQEIRRAMVELMGRRSRRSRPDMTARSTSKSAYKSWHHAMASLPGFSLAAGCAPAKPSIPAGAGCPRRSSPRSIAREGFSPSRSTSSTACGTSPRSRPASPRCARPAPRRSCACRSAISRWRAACSISAPKASSRR